MGTLATSAKNAFLNRIRRDFRKWKGVSNEELEQRMLQLPVQPPIWYKLNRTQKICFLIGAEELKFSYWLDTGVGKTLLSIALIRYFRKLGKVKRALILVPQRTNKTEWRDELLKHSPNSSCLILKGAIEDRWKALQETNTLFVVESYSGLFRMVTKKGEKRGKNALVFDPKKIRWLQKSFQGFVCDESVNVGNSQKLPFRVCRQLSNTSKVAFTMTGTPFNRDPSLMWAQMFLVDGGYTLGETLGLFRAIFCNESTNYFSGHPEFKFSKKKTELLHDFIANKSVEFKADQADLPACVEVQKYFDLSDDALSYYDKFKQDMIASHGNFKETNNSFIRLRQISSGFVGYEDDESGEKAKFVFPENPKFDLLMATLRTIPDYKSIIFFDFTFTGERLNELLTKEKLGPVLIYGKTRDTDKAKKQFMEDNKSRILLLQNKMSAGMNVQIAKYGFFAEAPVRAIDYKQSRRRVERQHSEHKTVFIYDMLMRNGVDDTIRKFHEESGDLFEAIIRGN